MKNVALIFPGQGAQFVGMGKEFYDSSREARLIFEQADTVIDGLSDVIFNGPEDKLKATAFCQPAIVTFSIAALRALQAHAIFKEINPVFTCGLSLGECSALAASGAMSFMDTLKLVERRSTFMEEATQLSQGAMAAIIGFDKNRLVAICEETGAQAANFNSPDQIVITGEALKVEKASAMIEEEGAKRVIPLAVGGAFHSTLMQPAADKFKEVLAGADINEALIPLISNVDAQPAKQADHIKRNLALQITSSVQWVDSVEYMSAQGVNTFIEIGPGNVLKGLLRKINRELKVFNVQRPEDIDKIIL